MNSISYLIWRLFPGNALMPAFLLLFSKSTTAQVPMFDFYFGPNVAVLNEIPEHFKQVNADYQGKVCDQ